MEQVRRDNQEQNTVGNLHVQNRAGYVPLQAAKLDKTQCSSQIDKECPY
jgi:hypothetical protein